MYKQSFFELKYTYLLLLNIIHHPPLGLKPLISNNNYYYYVNPTISILILLITRNIVFNTLADFQCVLLFFIFYYAYILLY